jgi:2-keto-3-deoxy-L-rhamnonate aldolase RhmA
MHLMDSAAARHWITAGMQFIAIGSDLRFMTTKAIEIIAAARGESSEKDIARY